MKSILLFFLVFCFVKSAICQVSTLDGANAVLGDIIGLIENGEQRGVVVESQASQPIVLSCASKNDRIRVNNDPNPTVKNGQAIGWAFKANELPGFSGDTQFWCTAVYSDGKKCGGDVFYQKWKDAPSVVHWTIKDNCEVLDWDNKPRPDIFHNE